MDANSEIRIGIPIDRYLPLLRGLRHPRARFSRYPRGSVGVPVSMWALLEEEEGGISATLYARARTSDSASKAASLAILRGNASAANRVAS
jgi:hypothetical protein